MRVDLVAPPFSGHLYPLLSLARELPQDEFSVRILTGGKKKQLVEQLGFECVELGRDFPGAMERIADKRHRVGSNPIKLFGQLRENLALLVAIDAEMENLYRDAPPEIVVADFVAPVAGLAADRFRIPWITTIPTPCALEAQSGTPSYLGGWRPSTHPLAKVRDSAGRLVVRSVKRSAGLLFRRYLKKLGARIYRDDGAEAIYSPYCILGLGMKEIEFPRTWPPAFEMIGPIFEAGDRGVFPRLVFPSTRSKRVLVTFGTHLPWMKGILSDEMKHLCAAFPEVQFVGTLGVADEFGAKPIEHSGNWSLYKYIPYEENLSAFDAVIHHGGCGIAYSCLEERLPALAFPRDYDQFDFAARLEVAGVCRRIHSLNRPGTESALRDILTGQLDSAVNQMSVALDRYDPHAAFRRSVRDIYAGGAR